MTVIAGIDIGGTKCAVSLASYDGKNIEILEKKRFLTPELPSKTIDELLLSLEELILNYNVELSSIGISCGGPLNSDNGLILSPPNLPGWNKIDIVSPFTNNYDIPVSLQNDANAGALAEWMFGSGQGAENLIFLTFGTGMGAGLILNGVLYSGTNDMAGEVGHVRLESEGPMGYGKAGSFEGYCSGGGIARLAQGMAREAIIADDPPLFCSSIEYIEEITAKDVGIAAAKGDKLALEIFTLVGHKLGKGLAMLVDILNPQKIIIGSIYGRQQKILEPVVLNVLQQEALSHSLSVCEIIPAGLGERIGDYASLSVALNKVRS